MVPKPMVEEIASDINQIELANHSIASISSYRTFKVIGNIDGHEVRILIDSGATHNFISDDLVKKIGLSVIPTKEFGVMVGDGYKIKGVGVCRNVKMLK